MLGDAALGAGSGDVVLESAMPLPPSEITGGTLTAPLVYVGNGSPAMVEHVDVQGKDRRAARRPAGAHGLRARHGGPPGASALQARGRRCLQSDAAARQRVARDFSDCGGPCVNIGGHDGHFLEKVLEKAEAADVTDKLRATVTLKSEIAKGLKADNVVGVIPGAASDEVVVLNAHYDGWFEGAGDNGDGLAVLMALARHFAKPEHRPRRTLALVASAGHHSAGSTARVASSWPIPPWPPKP